MNYQMRADPPPDSTAEALAPRLKLPCREACGEGPRELELLPN